jgi:transglutaminase-like putative cysteine protease
MVLIPEKQDLNEYLEVSEVIDYDSQNVQELAERLSKNIERKIQLAQRVYEYVRDHVFHSFDISSDLVTCKASDVLKHGSGTCFAKSHLLAALLRNLKIPTGFCYQRLVFDDSQPLRLTLHGLNAIYLSGLHQWIRVDARGNKSGVKAEFSIDEEVLAFPIRLDLGEVDYSTIYAQPNLNIIKALQTSCSCQELANNLPNDL